MLCDHSFENFLRQHLVLILDGKMSTHKSTLQRVDDITSFSVAMNQIALETLCRLSDVM